MLTSSLLHTISKIIQVKKSIINKERIFQDFHQLNISLQFVSLSHNYLEVTGLDVDPLFYQQVTQEMLESLLTQKFKAEQTATPDDNMQDRLITEGENGYVVRSVKESTRNYIKNKKIRIICKLGRVCTDIHKIQSTLNKMH